MNTRLAWSVIMAIVAALVAAAAAGAEGNDPLRDWDIPVTTGAAPGYVPDRACALCHDERYQSYQEVGMARSFFRPAGARLIEDFADNHFYHAPSKRHYEMAHRDGRLVFRRYQIDPDGRPINLFEQEVAWVLGSGHTSRTYLYRTPAGELYQLPLAWYSQAGRWGMAPGYDRAQHPGIGRQVRHRCMFCHNAYPEIPAGAGGFRAPQSFPAELPEGTGCQRCHGPGGRHVRLALGGEAEIERVRAAIVNPGELPAARRNDVCYQCHMLPAVAVGPVLRFGREAYGFRPGQPLDDYIVVMDMRETGKTRAERFEINHHPYRLEQSRCFRESEGALGCLTCHDPHRKVPAAERAAHYRTACLGCHQLDAGGRPRLAAGGVHPDGDGDCVACHMPRRRTQDVIQVTMTDHLIARRADRPAVPAPTREIDAEIEDVLLHERPGAPVGREADLYRAVAVIRASNGYSRDAVDHLSKQLAAVPVAEVDPYLELASAQLKLRRYADAMVTLAAVEERAPETPLALAWRGLAENGLGRRARAIAALERATALAPDRPDTWYNLGVVQFRDGRHGASVESLRRALALRPNFPAAWFYLGNAQRALRRPERAVDAYRRALELDPGQARGYVEIGRVLHGIGREAEALRYWRHGLAVLAEPDAIVRAMRQAGVAERQAPPSAAP